MRCYKGKLETTAGKLDEMTERFERILERSEGGDYMDHDTEERLKKAHDKVMKKAVDDLQKVGDKLKAEQEETKKAKEKSDGQQKIIDRIKEEKRLAVIAASKEKDM